MDAASSQPGDLLLRRAEWSRRSRRTTANDSTQDSVQVPKRDVLDDLWRSKDARDCGLSRQAFGELLAGLGTRLNHSLPVGTVGNAAEKEAFFRALHLRDLLLARACALGAEIAWQRFQSHYRAPLIQAAMAIAGSSALSGDDADWLYARLYGSRGVDGSGYLRCLLAAYTGRGTLLGWLRAMLAQRHAGEKRRFSREVSLDEAQASASAVLPPPEELAHMAAYVARALQALQPEEGFLLSAYFLDRQKLPRIGRTLGMTETAVSQRLKRLITELRADLLNDLQASGWSKRAAEERLGMDPRSLEIGDGLRILLQRSQLRTFSDRNSIVLKPARTSGQGTSASS